MKCIDIIFQSYKFRRRSCNSVPVNQRKIDGTDNRNNLKYQIDHKCRNKKPEILEKLAQYELTLLDWIEDHKGYRKYVTIAGKCWPAFQTQFGFVPCYVNSRLTKRGIPVSCEVDIYGALSEFIGTVASEDATTLLDINNTVPADIYDADIKGKFDYTQKDTFMGFHCGNTASDKLSFCEML